MKTLQNNFTTPEQSKRLLELGVPERTANCVLRHYNWADDNLDENNWELPCVVWTATELDRFIDDEYDKVLPCWSVGRLMEIIDICAMGEQSDPNTEEYPSTIKVMNKLHIPYVEYLVKSMERASQLEIIDFSKLEN